MHFNKLCKLAIDDAVMMSVNADVLQALLLKHVAECLW